MDQKQFKTARLVIVMLVAITVSTAVSVNNFYLALSGVLIGMLFMWLVRLGYKKAIVDERVNAVSGRAARMSYAVTTMTLMALSLFFIISGKNGGQPYVEALGTIFGFVTLFAVAIYSISFHYYDQRYGGDR